MKKELKVVIPGLLLGLIFLTSCAARKPVQATEEERLAALEGADIPLGELIEGMAFTEPLPEDALILKEIHFDFDKSGIKDSEKPILDEINTWLMNHPRAEFMIEGHCDERGTKEYNLALGERRALSIRSYLTGLGSNPARLYTISYGEENPLCTASEESCWWKNRRGHFLVDYGTGEAPEVMAEPISPAEAKEEIEETIVVEEVVPEPREEAALIEEEITTRQRVIGRYHY